MSLILRAHVAAAATEVVPSWPLESFIAVNPLGGRESHPFEDVDAADAAITRARGSYLRDLERGRMTAADLEAAILQRVPGLSGDVTVGSRSVPAVSVAAMDMRHSSWASASPSGSTPSGSPASGSTPSRLDDYLSTWVSAYLGPDPVWPMPHREQGFYRAWRALARADPSLPRSARRQIAALPDEADVALASALDRLGLGGETVRADLHAELRMLPGWVGHIKWRAEKVGDIDLTSYLAVRLTLRALLGPSHSAPPTMADPAVEASADFWSRAENIASLVSGVTASREDTAVVARVLATHPVADHPVTWQTAYELGYRTPLLARLSGADPDATRPEVQVVMCIDPRSEGVRRHLEARPSVETYGFAGFFGIPVRFARYQARGAINSLPALLTARHIMTEQPTDADDAQDAVTAARAQDAVGQAIHESHSRTATPFAYAEVAGWLYGALSAVRTLAPGLSARLTGIRTRSARHPESTVTVADSFTLSERAAMAEVAVRMMGITRFAPLVVLAGHGSESLNNLYESALDCGACGGNPGAANARAAVGVFNDPEVRSLLAARGIHIPADTVFVAAEHNTVTDIVTLLDPHLLPASHRNVADEFDRLQRDAADGLVRERAIDLPGASPSHAPARMRRRAHDWAEVYPELGLAGNAAMIIGPRELTRGVDLRRRVFLHSYLTELDPDGTALETIMTAPLVVAQWINHQYYFSALNPATLGAGTKTIHNAIGTIGVIAGQGGDLRRGLPWQSVGLGDGLFHEPMRLAAIIQAPLERVSSIVSRNQVLRDLFDNDWISLTARDDSTSPWQRYSTFGWKAVPTSPEGSRS